MHNALDDYLCELRARNYSGSRLLHISRAVTVLSLYLKEAHGISDWCEVQLPHLQGFTIFAAARYRTPQGRLIGVNTLRQWLSCVRVFFSWMKLRGRLASNPAEEIPLPKSPRSLPKVLGEKTMARLIDQPDTGTAIGIRDRALIEVLYATGIRHGEAYTLNINDIEIEAGLLIVRQGKGRRDRFVPLTEVAARWLSLYVAVARPQLAEAQRSGDEWSPFSVLALWLSKKGRRLSYQMISERIGVYAVQAGVAVTVHTFRHSCATHLLRGGAGTRYIQQLLGHQSIKTTEVYTQVEVKDLRRAMQKALRRLERDPAGE